MTEQTKTRYDVKILPCRVGFLASVGKQTCSNIVLNEPFWMGWEPEPTFWRPTEEWAVRRAARKLRSLIAADARRAARSVRLVSDDDRSRS